MKRLVCGVMILVSLLLTGCGFHMRGEVDEKLLPSQLKAIHVVGDDRSDLAAVGLRLRGDGMFIGARHSNDQGL